MRRLQGGRVFVWVAALSAATAVARGGQATFPSPEKAASALFAAVEADDYELFLSIAGPQMARFWSTDDPLRDALDRDRFVDTAYKKGIRIVAGSPDRMMLYVGGAAEPFPAPLVKTAGGWQFDTRAGSVELTAQQIQRNETAVVELCRRFFEAEFTYVDGAYGSTPGFAQKIRSTPGQRDGLFWTGGSAEDESPLGPLFAAAAFSEREPGGEPRPLFGYYFRVLPVPEPGKGFALIAWPAEYGADGLRTFLITESGGLYQRDLGADGSRLAGSMTTLDPGWNRVENVAATARVRKD